ncbi:MAG: hypothetical protein JO071_03875 [Deltaproteobacteria bacterium]|nr:hypothetical protein [Deltaproteobacteria bacterium]
MNSDHYKVLETLSGDDPVLGFEYYAMQTHNALEGERALMFAVLVDALDTYIKTRNAKGHRKRVEFNEVDSWIRSRTTGSPFAFESICDSLGFNPGAIRFSLKSPRFNERNTIGRFHQVVSHRGLDSASAS